MEVWKESPLRQKFEDKILYVTSGNNCYKVTTKEADNHIIPNAKHATSDYGSVVIVADDTDILVFSMAFQNYIDSNLFLSVAQRPGQRCLMLRKCVLMLSKEILQLCWVFMFLQDMTVLVEIS